MNLSSRQAGILPQARPQALWCRGIGAAVLMGCMLLAATKVQAGQESAGPIVGTISGNVVSAEGGEPLAQADVVLVPAGTDFGGFSAPSALPPGSMIYVTQADGAYRFDGVPAGNYRLYVHRAGYRAAVIAVELSEEAALRLSIGLVIAPIELSPVEVEARRIDAYGRDVSLEDEVEPGRISAVRSRQAAFLESDVRSLTHTDVIEAITLGGTDLFRALHRAPGVNTRDDWTAELWVRGAPWGQTRVYFDGMPLFNPVHAGGLISAVNPDAVGSVLLHPGVRSASVGDGAAAILDISSRPAGGAGDLRGYAGVTLADVGLAMEKRMLDGRLGVSLATRVSDGIDGELLPWSGSTNGKRVSGSIGKFPEDFFDLVGHVDLELDGDRRLEFSGLVEEDYITGGIAGGPNNNHLSWGNLAARATLQTPVRGISLRQTVGFSRFHSSVRQAAPKSPLAAFDSPPTQQPTENEISYLTVSGEVVPRGVNADVARSSWRGGYQVTHQRVGYYGSPPTPFPVQTFLYTLQINHASTLVALWGERRWLATPELSLQAGLRLEAGDAIEPWGVRLGPRISTRYALSERLSLSAAAGRHYQYMHTLAPSGLRVGPRLGLSHIRLLAGERGNPPIRTDVATIGTEYWLGRTWLAAANLYVRRSSDLLIPDPTPGSVDDHLFKVSGTNLARGLEVSARRLAGRWTASFAYTLAASELEAVGYRFPSPTDRTHAFDATLMSRFPDLFLGGSVRVGSAFGAASGTPYTRVHLGWYNCDRERATCQAIVPNTAGQPNAQRASWSQRLDLMADWTKQFKAWQLGFYVQVQNATDAERGVTYAVNQNDCRRRVPGDPFCDRQFDEFVPGVQRLQVIGVRVAF